MTALLQATTMAIARPWLKVFLWWGATGTGKTLGVYQNFPASDVYKVLNVTKGWFDGYANHKVALIDDFSGAADINELKKLLDTHPHHVEAKGTSMPWNPETIIITSNSEWTAWYPQATSNDLEAILRRLSTGGIFQFPHQKDLAYSTIKIRGTLATATETMSE